MGSEALKRHNVSLTGNPDATRWMILVHGFGTDQSAWRYVAAAFAQDYRVVLLDNAGAGGADPTAFIQLRYLNLDQYAADLIEITEAVGARDAVLVGHSVGAIVGLLAAVARPELYSTLILIGASPRYLDEPGYRGGFSEADLEGLYAAVSTGYPEWAERYSASAMPPERPDLARDFAASLRAIPPDHALTVLCSIFQSDHRADLARVRQPTLIIQSRDDIAVPIEVAQYIQHAIQGSELTVVEASGHFPHISAPGLVVAAMRSFLNRRAAS